MTIRPKVRPEPKFDFRTQEDEQLCVDFEHGHVEEEKLDGARQTFQTLQQPLLQQEPATHVQPSPPVDNHVSSATQPRSIEEVLANDVPQGSTLDIDIPCIISSRFEAYARYIGEVLGESGPWVGVEVPIPIGDTKWRDREGEKPADERQWNDGSWRCSVFRDWRHARWIRVWGRSYREDAGSVVWGTGEKGEIPKKILFQLKNYIETR